MMRTYNGFELNYEKIWIIATSGEIKGSLRDKTKALVRSNFDLEVSPIRDIPLGEYNVSELEMYCFNPIMNGTQIQTDNEITTLIYSCHREKSKELMSDLLEIMNIHPTCPQRDFIDSVKEDFKNLVESYKDYKDLAREKNIEVEKAFGYVTYVAFLTKYGMSDDEALERSNNKFGVKLL